MPLMKSRSKKAFDHNVKAEMESGKPQKQSLAIAYSVKNKKKKMAKGGPVSAKEEKRPMPAQKANDSKDVAQANHKKANGQDGALQQPTVKQALMNNGRKVLPIKHPRMVGSDSFQVKLRDEEDDLQHLADGGMINEDVSMSESEEDHAEHPAGLESDNDQMKPSDEEIMANHFAEGGEIDAEDEMAIDHAASIAAAIMAKRRKFAEGGEVDLSLNADEEPNHEDQMSLEALKKENYSESAALDDMDQPLDSNEDSPEHDEEDVHDRSIASAIRRKMKSKSPISR